ncbi:hypothetical protein COLO4_06139 [Corchorus olitorius]|uniref:Uncharacterized protein n=1 Tax=Corchorus olitorius TaxID=93759 RepID=A0A1R3KNV8_9ROSI|nr:hypothetical protein COLO4_06139 [Corchorus olitorius]
MNSKGGSFADALELGPYATALELGPAPLSMIHVAGQDSQVGPSTRHVSGSDGK